MAKALVSWIIICQYEYRRIKLIWETIIYIYTNFDGYFYQRGGTFGKIQKLLFK